MPNCSGSLWQKKYSPMIFIRRSSSISAAPPPPPGSSAAAASDKLADAVRFIRANDAFVVSACQPLTDFEFSYSAGSVKWLDSYTEKIRTQRLTDAEREQLVSTIGAYLGEAIIAVYGGAWSQDEFGWHIRFDEKNRAYPFNKVAK